MVKAVFLDRDGTINIEKHYLYKKEDFKLIPGVIDALKLLQNAGYLLIIITNQSGIGRGYYSEDDFWELNSWMVDRFRENGVLIADVLYCPHLPDARVEKYRVDCDCRKPKLGLFMRAINKFHINLSNSYAIGDKIRDCEICKTTDCKGFLISNNEKPEVISDVINHKYCNVEYCSSLYECALKITSNDIL